jgi:hypothetical protein
MPMWLTEQIQPGVADGTPAPRTSRMAAIVSKAAMTVSTDQARARRQPGDATERGGREQPGEQRRVRNEIRAARDEAKADAGRGGDRGLTPPRRRDRRAPQLGQRGGPRPRQRIRQRHEGSPKSSGASSSRNR